METLSPWRKKPRDKLRIISLYKIEITTLRDTTWVKKKKNSLFLLTHCSLPHCVFSLTLFIFLFSFACSHSRSSSRLHLVLTTLWDFTSFSLCPNGRMASTFISSSFPSFLPFTLFTSSHIKCKPTYLDFASTNFFSLALPYPNDHAFYFFLFFLPSACPTRLSQPTHADFVHNEEKLRTMNDMLIKWACLLRGLDSWCSAPINLPLQPTYRGDLQLNSSVRIHAGQVNTRLNLLHYLH